VWFLTADAARMGLYEHKVPIREPKNALHLQI
jgi:hypothetical protein